MKSRLYNETQSINMLKQSSFHCLAGQERKEEEMFKPTKTLILSLDKIWISFQSGTKDVKF